MTRDWTAIMTLGGALIGGTAGEFWGARRYAAMLAWEARKL